MGVGVSLSTSLDLSLSLDLSRPLDLSLDLSPSTGCSAGTANAAAAAVQRTLQEQVAWCIHTMRATEATILRISLPRDGDVVSGQFACPLHQTLHRLQQIA